MRAISSCWLMVILVVPAAAVGQPPNIRIGDTVPRDVREMYDRGLQFLATTQTEKGDWASGGNDGPGVTGLALMAFLASGEDPNFGLYSNHVRRCLRNIITSQNNATGYIGSSMYHHGFAMLGLAEAYGAVDERNLWPDDSKEGRSIGTALELSVRAAITAQKKNSTSAWRYSPDSNDADTSVSGAVLVGLLAARNAGIEVPDESIEKAISYYAKMTSSSGQVGYSGAGGHGDSTARSSIATLVFAVARRKDLPQFKSALGYLVDNWESTKGNSFGMEYQLYYQSQALFQGDVEAWEKWNTVLIRRLKQSQSPNGSFVGQLPPPISTSMSLLALALNYRFLPIYER